jgi:hypothetical protein
MMNQTQDVRRRRSSAVRTLGLYLAVFGATLIFATAIAAQPANDEVTTKSVWTNDETPRRNSVSPASEPLTLLDVRRLPRQPGEDLKRKIAA